MPKLPRFPFYRQQKDYTCGPVAVMMVLRHFGFAAGRTSLRRALATTEEDGTARLNIVRFLRGRGLAVHVHAGATVGELRAFLGAGIPVIVNYREPDDNIGHYAVVVGVSGGRVVLNDPYHGRGFSVTVRVFAARWRGGNARAGRRWMAAVARNKAEIAAVGRPCGTRGP